MDELLRCCIYKPLEGGLGGGHHDVMHGRFFFFLKKTVNHVIGNKMLISTQIYITQKYIKENETFKVTK